VCYFQVVYAPVSVQKIGLAVLVTDDDKTTGYQSMPLDPEWPVN
jgi:hypothetical protein